MRPGRQRLIALQEEIQFTCHDKDVSGGLLWLNWSFHDSIHAFLQVRARVWFCCTATMVASYTYSLQRVLADELTHTDAQKQTNLTFHFPIDETRFTPGMCSRTP